jgi:hypothetical protein
MPSVPGASSGCTTGKEAAMVVHVLFDVGDDWRALLLGAPPALF